MDGLCKAIRDAGKEDDRNYYMKVAMESYEIHDEDEVVEMMKAVEKECVNESVIFMF